MGFPNSPSQLTSWLAVVRQPASVAALISVGVHVALFGAAPSFSNLSMAALGSGGEPGEQRTVPLIELTPEEQGRLPDFSSPAYSLFPDAGGTGTFELLPVPGATTPITPPSGSSFSSLPNLAIGMNPYTPPGSTLSWQVATAYRPYPLA